jgi:single-strand DNA-binding protein
VGTWRFGVRDPSPVVPAYIRTGASVLNMVVVIGSLAKPLQVRSLPSGLSLASFDLLVPRADQSADTVPVALFDSEENLSDWGAGQEVLALGRVRRRFFRVEGSTQSRTEVVADKVLALNHKESVCSALAGAGSTLAGVLENLQSAG